MGYEAVDWSYVGKVQDSCERGVAPLGFIKREELFDQVTC